MGIIPARAGFTRGAHIRGDDTEDHPRSRGVYGPVQVRAGWRPRIIPARAGFTPGRRRSPGRGSDHPRSRGVYAVLPAGVQTGNGSSPLARGLQNEPSADTQPRRIIPARAGFTHGRERPARKRWDHPRSRGVYTTTFRRPGRGRGSSPLARGLPMAGYDLGTAWRIIPARAGFTYTPPRSVEIDSDHPRSRGVYCPAYQGGLLVGRIIPARAGFTWPDLAVRRSERDHPRSRGVYPGPPCQNTSPNGSSPLARGLQGGHADAAHHPGIIPARAGFTIRY